MSQVTLLAGPLRVISYHISGADFQYSAYPPACFMSLGAGQKSLGGNRKKEKADFLFIWNSGKKNK